MNPLKPTSADLNRSRLVTDQVIAQVMKEANAKIVPDTFEESVIRRANIISKQCQDEFLRMHKINIVPMKAEEAVAHIKHLYKAKYSSWTKEELMELCCLVQSVLAVESLRDNLI